MRWISLLLFAALGAACGPSIQFAYHPVEVLQARANEPLGVYPARYLYRNTNILMVSNWRSPSYMQIQEERVLRIESESGFKYADVRVVYPSKARFVAFAGRTISKDGTVTEITPSRVYDTEAVAREKREENVAVRVFAFPKVEVGDVIELHHIIEVDEIVGGLDRWIGESIPIEKQKIQMQLTKDIIYALGVYNMNGDVKTEDLGELWRLSIELNNVPAMRHETAAPDREHYAPWWRFRVLQFAKFGIVSNVHVSWNSTAKRSATKLYFDNEENYAGFHSEANLTGCADTSCKIERVLEDLRNRAPLKSFGRGWSGRKAQEVVAAGGATAIEKARLLWWSLRKVGVEAKFAMGGRFLDAHIDRNQPYAPALDHAILFVPKQNDIAQDLWIDPSCEYCALGEIPDYVEGTDFFVIDATQNTLGTVTDVKGSFTPVIGKSAMPEQIEQRLKLDLDPDGKLIAKIERRLHGRSAQQRKMQVRGWSDKEWREDFEGRARWRHRAAKVSTFEKLSCENAGSCVESMVLYVPAYTARRGDDVVVPLSIISSVWDDRFTKKKRKLDIDLRHPYQENESVILTLPEGYRLASAPAEVTDASTALKLETRVKEQGGAVEITRSLRATRGRYGVESYAPLRAAIAKYSALRREVLVLSKK